MKHYVYRKKALVVHKVDHLQTKNIIGKVPTKLGSKTNHSKSLLWSGFLGADP